MTTKEFHVKYSLRTRLLTSFLIIIGGMIFFLLLFNNLSGYFFYENSKERVLKEGYYKIEEELNRYVQGDYSKEQLIDKLNDITDDHEMHAIVVDSDWSLVFVCDYTDKFLKDRLVSSIMNLYDQDVNNEDTKIIEDKDGYVLQKVSNKDYEDEEAYELWGTLSNGYTVMCRLTSASIKNSVEVMNHVILISGIILLIGAIVAAFIVAKLITAPLENLTRIAVDMSSLDFNARYTGKNTSEIGYLGATMNKLSDKLEDSITKLKMANLELEIDLKNKENIQKQQKDFLSSISHELKTPLALIAGYAEALRDGLANNNESKNEYCNIIIDESNKMNKLIKQILALNELESGNIELSIERFSVTSLICSVLNANRIEFEKKDIKVKFADQNDDVFVWGDKLKVEEVLTNFISNAINYSSGKKIIKISIEQHRNISRIHVWNSGDNIPEEDINEIWNKFYKVDKARSRKYGGNGMGLSIVKTIADLHGQKCGADNTPGGVDFWYDLDSEKGGGVE